MISEKRVDTTTWIRSRDLNHPFAAYVQPLTPPDYSSRVPSTQSCLDGRVLIPVTRDVYFDGDIFAAQRVDSIPMKLVIKKDIIIIITIKLIASEETTLGVIKHY